MAVEFPVWVANEPQEKRMKNVSNKNLMTC